MQLLITIKQPFRVWVSVVSAASAFVVKSSDNIVEANIPTSSKSDRVERLIAGSRGDRIPSYFQRSQFPLHPSSPRCSLRMEYPLREEDDQGRRPLDDSSDGTAEIRAVSGIGDQILPQSRGRAGHLRQRR